MKQILEMVKKVMSELPEVDVWAENHPVITENDFKRIIAARLYHCGMTLLDNSNKAKIVRHIAVWPDGHFSLPVFEELSKAILEPQESWNKAVWQQIARQLYNSEKTEKNITMFNAATEQLLCL